MESEGQTGAVRGRQGGGSRDLNRFGLFPEIKGQRLKDFKRLPWFKLHFLKKTFWELLWWSRGWENPPCNAGNTSWIPDGGTEIPQATRQLSDHVRNQSLCAAKEYLAWCNEDLKSAAKT